MTDVDGLTMAPGGDRPVTDDPPPGGPHDPGAPDRLEPEPGASTPALEPPLHGDEPGIGPEGDDPMVGDAPSG